MHAFDEPVGSDRADDRSEQHDADSPADLPRRVEHAELEARLGARLLNRTTRSLSVTEAGARVKPAMAEMAAAIEEVNHARETPAGLLRLHIPRLAAAEHLEPHLGGFHRAYPDIIPDVSVNDSVVDIVAAGFDVGVRLGELLRSDMVAIKLGGNLRQIAVASPDYLARHGRPQTPVDLHHHRCVNWRQPGSSGLYAWEFCKDGEWFEVAVNGPLIVSHRDMALAAALQGVGVAYWSEARARPMIEAGRLVPLLEEWSPPFPGWHLYYPTQRYTPATVRALADFLRQSSEEPASDVHIDVVDRK